MTHTNESQLKRKFYLVFRKQKALFEKQSLNYSQRFSFNFLHQPPLPVTNIAHETKKSRKRTWRKNTQLHFHTKLSHWKNLYLFRQCVSATELGIWFFFSWFWLQQFNWTFESEYNLSKVFCFLYYFLILYWKYLMKEKKRLFFS